VNFQSEKVSDCYGMVDDARTFSCPCLYEVVVFNLGNIFIYLLQIWVKPEGLRELSQVFKKLRFVNLSGISEECDLTWTMFVLHGAPFLEELCIMVKSFYLSTKSSFTSLHANVFLMRRNIAGLRLFGDMGEKSARL
jgi:hypothetical protein